jgi:pantothenate kinase
MGDFSRWNAGSLVARPSEAVDSEALLRAARGLIRPGRRTFIGITGAPGAGKSTLAEFLVSALDGAAVLVTMDGFHLADEELRRLGRLERKGAADTFDVAGYVHLLRRLHERADSIVYAPRFDRALEESIGSAVPVPAEVPLIITEGNYLLIDDPGWSEVAELLDECWYLEPGEDERLSRLVARHVSFGRSADEALARSLGTDGRNAEVVANFRHRATKIFTIPSRPPR